MSQSNGHAQGWRGVALIAITYVYFLIFAQFGFLARLSELGIADAHLKAVMAAMAMGGIAFSLLTPRLLATMEPALRLRLGFALCATAALLSITPLAWPAAIAVALMIGIGLGVVTVTLVTHLPTWLGDRRPLLGIGLGTGLGYFLCNVPALFTAAPSHQAAVAASLCVLGCAIATSPQVVSAPFVMEAGMSTLSLRRALIGFTALIWFDSAAFYIIQHVPTLKAGTWQGNLHLWTNGVLHLAAALACVWLLRHRGAAAVIVAAVLVLGAACLLLHDPSRVALASLLYPVGVSLYSVAWVAYPSMLSPASSIAERGRRAGWIYATAGWFGSAMGIGMAQNLGHVPLLFVVAATAAVLLPEFVLALRTRGRELVAVAITLALAFALWHLLSPSTKPAQASTAVQRGRQVYISEGCIHCHSQYVRPHTQDVLLWGPAQSVEALREQHPPLIGNRRQGPDLSEVGTRRSPLWMRAHFEHPAEVSHDSFMPSYAHLFQSGSGNDLIAYLQSLRGGDEPRQLAVEQSWQPNEVHADASCGPELFARYCATCHSSDGVTRLRWQSSFHRLPPDLFTGPWQHLDAKASVAQRAIVMARIIKFGLHGTDMPGHEYLPDEQISSLSAWLAQSMALPNASLTLTQSTPNPGDHR